MNKIYSIAFESKIEPKRLALFTAVAGSSSEVYKLAIETLTKDNADLIWEPKMTTTSELPVIVDKDKNFMLNCIVTNKDVKLFEVGKKYLTGFEVKFIEEKLNESTT